MATIRNATPAHSSGDFPYFRHIWKKVILSLLGASFIPLIIIGGGMYYYTASLLKQKTLDTLRMEVVHHKQTIDQFLYERAMDLKLLSQNLDLERLTRSDSLQKTFQSLQKELPCFVDLGVIDDQGRHLAYVGPYELISKNYQEAAWFKALHDRDIYISDVFLGFRNMPHFIIAVKQSRKEGYWILRATVDSAFFDGVVTKIKQGEKGDAFLINKKGVYQTTPRRSGRLMEPSRFKAPDIYSGVRETEQNGVLRVMVWLDRVPWLCVVQMERKEIFGQLYKVRNIGVFVFILGGILIVLTVLLTTNYLIGRLEFKRKSIQTLDHHLQHTSQMAFAMKLFPSFLFKVKDLWGEIDNRVQTVQQLLKKDLTHEETACQISETIDQVRERTRRGRYSIDAFLDTARSVGSLILDVDINALLDNLMEIYDIEFHFRRIRLIRNYTSPAPVIRSDPERLRQVFQNILFIAADAISRDGKIILKTETDGDRVRVTVTDSGSGIAEEDLDKIFDPHYISEPEGKGFGLSISHTIIERIGGAISVRNEPERGASYIVELPIRFSGSEE